MQKGQLKIAISTNGKSPTAAKRIKEVLNHALPAELNDVLNNLNVVRNRLNGNFAEKVKKLNELTKMLVEDGSEKDRKWRKIATRSLQVFALMLIGHFVFSYVPWRGILDGTVDLYKTLEPNFPIMLLAGFLAQLVDGALGMGYGVTSATILLSAGVNPAAISGSIHTAEMFASGTSGYSHYKFGNVNKKLFKALLIPGVIGAVLGAVLLIYVGDKHAGYIRPVMAAYTLFLGVRILSNAFRKPKPQKKFKRYGLLAGAGGFLDSFGGGGWGPDRDHYADHQRAEPAICDRVCKSHGILCNPVKCFHLLHIFGSEPLANDRGAGCGRIDRRTAGSKAGWQAPEENIFHPAGMFGDHLECEDTGEDIVTSSKTVYNY